MAVRPRARPGNAKRLPPSEVKGICATCANYPRCQHTLRSRESGVVYCNEFDMGPWTGRRSKIEELPPPSPAPVPEGTLPGLCANCALAGTCRFPKPPSGVWHCNEYR